MAANSLRSRSPCQSSSVTVSNALAWLMPALLTTMSTLPKSATTFFQVSAIGCGLGDVAGIGLDLGVGLAGGLLHLGLGRGQRIGLARQHRHRAARSGEFLGHGEAETGARTGDHGHAAVHAYVHCLLLEVTSLSVAIAAKMRSGVAGASNRTAVLRSPVERDRVLERRPDGGRQHQRRLADGLGAEDRRLLAGRVVEHLHVEDRGRVAAAGDLVGRGADGAQPALACPTTAPRR